jgi:hypothetical protein
MGSGSNGRSLGGVGVYGQGDTHAGVFGGSISGDGVSGDSSRGRGVFGLILDISSTGSGVMGVGAQNVGVFGISNDTGVIVLGGFLAGFFFGDVHVTGNLSKGGGGFSIDHPLEPANRTLHHSFVESPERKNVYDGIVVCNRRGEAVVRLPKWFEALNEDFRYQLTPIGGPAPDRHIAGEAKDNRFKIGGGTPGLKVSWQVTGLCQDPRAKAHPLVVEKRNPIGERGRYLHPGEHGKPAETSFARDILNEARKLLGERSRRER